MLRCNDQLVGGTGHCAYVCMVPKLIQNANFVHAGMFARGRGALPGMVVIQTSLADVYSRLWHLGSKVWRRLNLMASDGSKTLSIF